MKIGRGAFLYTGGYSGAVVKDIDLKKLDFHRFGSDIVHNWKLYLLPGWSFEEFYHL